MCPVLQDCPGPARRVRRPSQRGRSALHARVRQSRRYVDPIEKKPFFHFLPGTQSYSIATVGCNFRCLHCQNYEISQQPKQKEPPVRESGGDAPEILCLSLRDAEARIPGEPVTPEQIVAAAQQSGCGSIAYTYTEPTIFFELAYDTARLAASEDLGNVFVTNSYITEVRRTSTSRASTTPRTSG